MHTTEKVHSSFCKFVLGVSKFASNYAVMGELGRVPHVHTIQLNHVLYWLHLEQGTQNKLLNNAYNECKHNRHSFMESIKYVLSVNGMADVMQNSSQISKGFVKDMLKRRLKDQHIQIYQAKLERNIDTLYLCELEETYSSSRYLDIIRNIEIRNMFTKLRINHNKLKGCLYNQEDTNCATCRVTESTMHFLLDCKEDNLQKIRTEFYEKIAKIVKNFTKLNKFQKLKQILNLEFPALIKDESSAVRLTCKFVQNMYSARFSCR